METLHQFSPLDEIMPPIYNAFIYGFPCPSTKRHKVLSILDEGWSKTLDERPILTGEVEFDSSECKRPGSLNLKIPESRQERGLVVNDMTVPGSLWKDSYEDLRAQGMPLSKLDGNMLAPLASGVGSTFKVVTVQINIIPGGCLLSLCTSHSFTDAHGNALILEMWARNCRQLQNLSTTEVSNGGEIHVDGGYPSLRSPVSDTEYEQLKHRPELWNLLGLHATENTKSIPAGSTTNRFSHFPATAPVQEDLSKARSIFSITPEALKRLKQDATPEPPGWISSADALVALLWRSIMRARFPHSSLDAAQSTRESIVTVALDGRKLLSPPVPASYVGNVVFCCMTRLSLGVLLSPESCLANTAVRIRSSVNEAKKPQVLKDAVGLASSIPDVRQLKIAFSDFYGPDLITTSWIDLPFYHIEFGPIFGATGRAEFFRIPRGQFGGICSLQPRQMNGVIDIIIQLEAEQMKRLRVDEEFTKYVKIVSD